MGRSKQFETEPSLEAIKQSKRCKSVMPAGTQLTENYANMNTDKLIKHVKTRVWRALLAFGLSVRTISRGFLRKNGVLKLGVISVLIYALFSTNFGTQTNTAAQKTKDKASLTALSLLNDAAPVAVDELAEQQARAYIERYAPIAVAEMKRYGIPASISLAQGLVESRAGLSTLAKRNQNHFGMKCFSRKCKKGHCSNHTDDTHKDFFRVFKSPWDSWRAHSQMLAAGRYTVLQKHGSDYKAWANGLRELGYATDKKYDTKLIGMIERYQLNQYD
jgi:flagellum-specific peptidoglycan hydrolase FlgJ